jgi:phosphatidylglycerol:prolipoprotein diacylglycerol transferase
MPLKLWWGLVAVAVFGLVYGAVLQRKADRQGAMVSLLVALGAGVGAYVLRDKSYQAEYVPIYSYGVMLGLSLVVGWYITLTLAEKDGLPKETMANCYVFTAVAAIIGSRLLYIVTNLDEFKTMGDLFALRRGGLVAYGGFLGGYVGSWMYLSRHKIRLMPWADVAVPSLASGLLITRIGCYLFGCDFGKRLPEGAPAFLKHWGTFPHWAAGTLDSGDGSPAYVRHLELWPEKARSLNASLPVHPTQLYESAIGLILLGFLLWQRKNQKFRGQIFFLFTFGYGVARFLLEIIRDDVERGEYGPIMAEHLLVPGALFLMSLGFIFGIALGIKDPKTRMATRVAALVPPVLAYIVLRPATFGSSISVQLSTSQWIALASALAVSYYYAKFWEEARKNPKLAMSLGAAAAVQTKAAADEEEAEEDEEDEPEEQPEVRASSTADSKKGTLKEEGAVGDEKKKGDSKATVGATPEGRKKLAELAAQTRQKVAAEKQGEGTKGEPGVSGPSSRHASVPGAPDGDEDDGGTAPEKA